VDSQAGKQYKKVLNMQDQLVLGSHGLIAAVIEASVSFFSYNAMVAQNAALFLDLP